MLLRKIKVLFPLVLLMVFITACQTDFDDINYYDGDADFSTVVAVGGSHLAGYSDMALYYEAQSNSIPAILATRFSFVGGGAFSQPLVIPGVGIGISGNSKYVLKQVPDPCQSGNILLAKPVATTGDISIYNWLGNQVDYNNLAVPNTRIWNLTQQSYGYPDASVGNLLYSRFATQPGTSTISGDALSLDPTFVLIWMGMEDIFNFALTGGDQGSDSITGTSVFDTKFNNLVNQLTSQNAKGVLFNIPDPANIPFFTEIPYNGLNLTSAEAAALNVQFDSVGSSISFTAGANPYVVEDFSEPGNKRSILPDEFILMNVSRDSINCPGWGTTVPIPQSFILDSQESAAIYAAIAQYNQVIKAAAEAAGLALVDVNELFKTLDSGILFNGVNFNEDYLTGAALSTDGYHLSQRGNAIVANEVVNVINRFYGAKVPLVDVNAYKGIVFP